MAHARTMAAVRGSGQQLGGGTRFLWGGLGALAPSIISLAILDYSALDAYIANIQPYSLAGYAFRVTALFGIGGLWAYFHRSEVEPLKLFQLGVVAPAMITAMISASNVTKPSHASDVSWLDLVPSLISPAYADTVPPPQPQPQQQQQQQQQTPAQQFLNGLLGR
jgi:hypothetical protein